MSKLIEPKHIQTKIEVQNWEEAIQQAGNLLIATNDITQAYIDSMIQSVKDLGPYIVLCPGFALAHSAPSKEVLRSSVSLITLKNPINFGSNNDPVNVVMCLACVDKVSHVENLQLIAKKLMKEGTITRIAECKDKEEIAKLFL